MNASFERHALALSAPFGIARGTTETTTAFLVRLDHDGVTGVGAGTPSEYYGETPADARAALSDCCDLVEALAGPHDAQRLDRRMRSVAPDAPAARSAVATALADLAARTLEVPLYGQLGLDPDATPRTSYTVSIADPTTMAERAEAAVDAGHDLLKVKLGSDEDRVRFDAVREAVPEATIRVDANGAWDAETAIERARWLADADVEFLEQPVPGDDLAGLRRVTEAAPLPICADESCVDASDVPTVADACDLVTVKLSKCGGLRAARRQIHAAQAHGLDVLLGCMVESNASIAPACHLAPMVEYADLDGALLLAEDPCTGVPLDDGAIDLRAVDVGTGARLAE